MWGVAVSYACGPPADTKRSKRAGYTCQCGGRGVAQVLHAHEGGADSKAAGDGSFESGREGD